MPEINPQKPIIEPSQLAQRLEMPTLLIFDCRFQLGSPEEGRTAYQESRIPGAKYLHLDEDLSSPIGDGSGGRHPLPDMVSFWSKMARFGVDSHSLVVCYDASGGAYASRFWWMLKWSGFVNVWVLNGGWQAWNASGFPIDESSRPAQRVAPEVIAAQVLSHPSFELQTQFRAKAGDFAKDLAHSNLVDSRTHDRFLGENEVIDHVAGHIPHAQNLPWGDNLNADGTFKSQTVLRERFQTLYESENRPIFYCGSGVTACHNILATQIAGFPMPSLYAESWSGWISDSDRPVQTGA
jgi:thiosulfate/3-mercaptopyruvate sulfurtransferase